MKKVEPDTSQRWPATGQEAVAQTETHKIPSERQETPFYRAGGRTLEEVALGSCGDFILGATQKPAEHNLLQLTLLWAGGGLANLWRSSPASAGLRTQAALPSQARWYDPFILTTGEIMCYSSVRSDLANRTRVENMYSSRTAGTV